MTLNPDLFLKAHLETDEYGSWQTSIFTPNDMIEEIKGINEDYKKLYQTDDDLIKVIDYKKEFIEESMADFDNNKELQKDFNYDRELYKKYSEKLFNKLYRVQEENKNN
ncbi:hypothetical protein [Brachyspira intermedia]|uniref:hypothetical protein n=2 Tax=Brachyspira intermedia TaxID=84377 RepID=UPI003005C44C